MKVHGYRESFETGREAELVVLKWLEKKFPEYKVPDVSKNPDFYGPDIDALIVSPELTKEIWDGDYPFPPNYFVLWQEGRCLLAVESKKDRWDVRLKFGTQNFAYETISHTTYGTLGCHRKTQADVLIHVSSDLKRLLYIDDVLAFREWCESYIKQHPEREQAIPNEDKMTLVHLIELSEMMKQPWIREEKI